MTARLSTFVIAALVGGILTVPGHGRGPDRAHALRNGAGP